MEKMDEVFKSELRTIKELQDRQISIYAHNIWYFHPARLPVVFYSIECTVMYRNIIIPIYDTIPAI